LVRIPAPPIFWPFGAGGWGCWRWFWPVLALVDGGVRLPLALDTRGG